MRHRHGRSGERGGDGALAQRCRRRGEARSLEFFTANGPDGVAAVGLPIFLDFKYCDIPNTVAGAILDAAGLSPFMLTVYVSGGPAMLRAATATSFRPASQNGGLRPLVIGVTIECRRCGYITTRPGQR